MASIQRRGKKYRVMWRDPDGTQRSRTCPDFGSARRLKHDVEGTVAEGYRWEPADSTAPLCLAILEKKEDGSYELSGGAFCDFIAVAKGRWVPGTVRHYDRALRRFLAHLAARHPRASRWTLDMLTRDALETFYGELKGSVSIATARLYVGAVVAAWQWAYDSDRYGEETPRPRRIQMETPTRSPVSAPTWQDMDAAIHAVDLCSARDVAEAPPNKRREVAEGWAWRRRLLVVLRFTGLRVRQAMRLQWDDIDLEAGELHLRGELGKSRRERGGRTVPLSPHLVEELATWGVREGWLIAPGNDYRHAHSNASGDAWRVSGVSDRVWGGRPHHAFRKGFKTGLARLGVERHVRDYLVGHHRGIDDHYLDSLEEARQAVALIPAVAPPAVRRLHAEG